jgi:hypothetical protein
LRRLSGRGPGAPLPIGPALAVEAGSLGLTIAALPAGLALAVRPWVGAGVEDMEIVLGVLIVGLRRDAVAFDAAARAVAVRLILVSSNACF